MSLTKKAVAELIGTFWLVFGGCGAAYFACGVPSTGIGYVGVSLAFGLTVLTMAAAIGHISGCHLNPAVTCGLCAAGRFDDGVKGAVTYIAAQIIGGILGALCIYVIAGCPELNGAVGGFATNGWSDQLVNGRNAFGGTTVGIGSAIMIETILTFVFLMIIIGSTDKRAPKGLAPVSIGLGLTLIHLISIPVTNTSVNPARSLAMAVFNGGESIQQVWVFLLFPIVGAVIAGFLYKFLFECKECSCGCDCKCSDKKGDCKCSKKDDDKKVDDKKVDDKKDDDKKDDDKKDDDKKDDDKKDAE